MSCFRLSFKIALVFTFGFLLYQCMYNSSNWQFLFDVDSETLIRKGKVTEIEGGIIKIYWALNGMTQDDPVLIEFIRENVLVEPDNLPLKLPSLKVSMTSLLAHTLAHSTRPSFRLKTNNQPLKKFLSLGVS